MAFSISHHSSAQKQLSSRDSVDPAAVQSRETGDVVPEANRRPETGEKPKAKPLAHLIAGGCGSDLISLSRVSRLTVVL